MRKTDKKKWRIVYPLFFILLTGLLTGALLYKHSRAGQVRVITYQAGEGWGYQISIKNKVFIDQPFIPVLPGRVPFPDRRAAYRTGKLVRKKLLHHESPALNGDDIQKLKLDRVGNANEK